MRAQVLRGKEPPTLGNTLLPRHLFPSPGRFLPWSDLLPPPSVGVHRRHEGTRRQEGQECGTFLLVLQKLRNPSRHAAPRQPTPVQPPSCLSTCSATSQSQSCRTPQWPTSPRAHLARALAEGTPRHPYRPARLPPLCLLSCSMTDPTLLIAGKA